MVIDTVIGAGVLANEHVVLRRTGDGELSLAGWRFTDGDGGEYSFPQLTLYKDGAINLTRAPGRIRSLTCSGIYFPQFGARGKIISLYDAQNSFRATYTLP